MRLERRTGVHPNMFIHEIHVSLLSFLTLSACAGLRSVESDDED